jgi:hypothetical protein
LVSQFARMSNILVPDSRVRLNSNSSICERGQIIKSNGVTIMASAPEFTDRYIKAIVDSLPDGVDQKRQKLLGKILREWAETDLPVYLSEPSTEIKRARTKRFDVVAKCSEALLKALDAVENNHERFWIFREMIRGDGQRSSQAELARLKSQLKEIRSFLDKLSNSSVAAGKLWKQGVGQPRNNAASLVLMDIIAIYEWVTGRKASRQVDSNTFEDTGPFWRFAIAIWPPVFGNGDYGLSAAIKKWDDATKKKLKGTRSPLLANIAMRQPNWRIF